MGQLSETVWAGILAHVRAHHGAIARGWFGQLRPGDLSGGELRVVAADLAQVFYLNEHCVRPFVEAAQAATGHLVSVRFESIDGASSPAGGPESAAETEAPPLRLSGDYTFDSFVVGPCNSMAQASCVAVAQSPGTAYNPLFIHGGVGLGKTHLLQAICHRVLDHSPATRIVYLSCEAFVNHFIAAVENGVLGSFRYRYRHADILMIDDVQFLANRERTQEEFFHTFNTLYHLHKQIVLSADCPPSEIPELEDRLVSRFKWGLVTRIDAPCLETRLAIVHKKMHMRGIQIPDDAAEFIASVVISNTRELEGALTRLHSVARLEERAIDLPLSRRVLGEEGPAARPWIRIQDIMGVVTETFDVKLSELQGRRRSRSIALPRQICMYLARQHTHHSLEEIGGFFGGRDHTTVMHANKLIARRREQDSAFRSQLASIEEQLSRLRIRATGSAGRN